MHGWELPQYDPEVDKLCNNSWAKSVEHKKLRQAEAQGDPGSQR